MKKIKDKTSYDIDAKTKSEWAKFEDGVAWEFDYFFDKIFNGFNQIHNQVYQLGLHKDINEFGIASSKGSTPIEIGANTLHSGYGISTMPSIFNKDPEWIKRTSYFYIKVETGGSSGGSCWDDDESYARPYYTGDTSSPEQLINILEVILSETFGSRSKGACDGITISEDSYTDYEYYGNHTDYQCQFITLWDLYKHLHEKDIF